MCPPSEPPAHDRRPPKHPDAATSKPALRRHFRSLRQGIDAGRRAAWTDAIHRHLLQSPAVTDAGEVAAFIAFDGEPDLRPLLGRLASAGHGIALPVLAGAGPETRRFEFRRWHATVTMAPNDFGIAEPRQTDAVPLHQIDLVLMPLVAWCRNGSRLGMGAGHYDRVLADCEGRHPLRVGVAYALQEAPALPSDPWDVPLHAVVTENGWTELGP